MHLEEKIKELTGESKALYYCDGGSRLWLTHSRDSDFDIRGLHLPSKKAYYHFAAREETLERRENKIEIVSYDIDKFFRLLLNSNPTTVEWMRADTVYLNRLDEWDEFRQSVLAQINFQALYYHYFSMAFNNIKQLETGKKFTAKNLIQTIRGILSAETAKKAVFPALSFKLLLEQHTTHPLSELGYQAIQWKLNKVKVPENRKEIILKQIKSCIQVYPGGNVTMSGNKQKLNEILSAYNFAVKEKYYGTC